MAGEWRRTKLGDVVEINPEVLGSDWPYDHIRYVDISSVGEGFLIELPRHLSITDAPSRAKRLVRSGDTILSTVRPNRRSMYFVKESSPDLVVSTGFAVLRPRENLIEPRYLYACVFDKNFTEYLVSREKGAAYPAVLPEDIADAVINLPPLPEQRAIAAVLGALDDKIELNRRMNRTLEAIAQAVFRHWFVENEEAEGWEVGQVCDWGKVITGKTPPTADEDNYNGNIPFITIPDMHGKIFVIETGKTLSEKGAQIQSNKTLPPFSICVSCIATPGLVSITTVPSQTNQQINSLIPKDKESTFYCYFALRELADEIRAHGSGGSVVLNLNKGQFEALPVLIPPIEIVHKFQRIVEPMLMKLLANEQQSRTLAALRDALLPKLMRGEVRVTVHEEGHA
jgi:type I restriction enzyme S subunit